MQSTHIQTGQLAKLFHVQTNRYIDLPSNLSIIYIGKPNKSISPDIDVSMFPNSNVISRVHATIQVEGSNYFIEDMGSSNGTYLNHARLTSLTRYSLKLGDRIDLCKDNKVTFLFQLSNAIPAASSKVEEEEKELFVLFTKFVGLALLLGGLAFLAESIVVGWFLQDPVVFLCISGLLVLQCGGSNRNLGWVLVGVGVAIAISTGNIYLTRIPLLPFLLAVSAFSAGYQLFTSGKVLNYSCRHKG